MSKIIYVHHYRRYTPNLADNRVMTVSIGFEFIPKYFHGKVESGPFRCRRKVFDDFFAYFDNVEQHLLKNLALWEEDDDET